MGGGCGDGVGNGAGEEEQLVQIAANRGGENMGIAPQCNEARKCRLGRRAGAGKKRRADGQTMRAW